MADDIREMLYKLRVKMNENKNPVNLPKSSSVTEDDNSLNRYKILMEDVEGNKQNAFVIEKNNIQFGNVRSAQEDSLRKTVGDVKLKDNALKYYPEIQDLVLNGEINGLGVTFQFRYKDPSGDGCYIWCGGLQLTDSNSRTIEKIRDAFLNWKQSLVEDGDLFEKLHKAATGEK